VETAASYEARFAPPPYPAVMETTASYEARFSAITLLDPVTTIGSVSGRGGLSARPEGVGGPLLDGGGLPGVALSTSLAGRFSLPALWRDEELAERRRSCTLCWL